jgi:hypothetical protein
VPFEKLGISVERLWGAVGEWHLVPGPTHAGKMGLPTL